MNDHELDQALGSLAPVRAADDFTHRVMARLNEAPVQGAADSTSTSTSTSTASGRRRLPSFAPWPVAVAASLLLLVVAAFATHQVFEQRHQQRLAKIQQLRSEHQELTDALASLRTRQATERPDAVLLMDEQGDGLIVPFEPAGSGLGLRPATNRLMPVEVRPASYRAY